MSARKRLKRFALRIARVCGLFALARALTRDDVRILGYHYVSMDDEETRFPSLFLTPSQLRQRLEHLRRCYRIVSLDEAVETLRTGHPGAKRVALTFDDGLYNFAAAAVPVLEEYGAPAAVYVVTAHVVNEIPVCVMALRDVLARADVDALRAPVPELGDVPSLATDEARRAFRGRAMGHLRTLPHAGPERLDFTRRVARALDVELDEILERRTWDVLTAEEMRDLTERGFAIEAHGHNHLDAVAATDRLFDEVDRCADVIEEATGRRPVDYCYPFGLWSRAGWPALERAGVRSATTTLYGMNSPRTPRLSLRRYMDGGDMTQLEFEFELSGLRWLLWGLRHRSERWQPAEKLELYTTSGQLY
ncbi:MAG: polysaccharide deacetylase family protein [Gemmatimonadetes bacterium]|nr:polysaccharide deacetylase family protein [Gemmatimonadota bacterium]